MERSAEREFPRISPSCFAVEIGVDNREQCRFKQPHSILVSRCAGRETFGGHLTRRIADNLKLVEKRHKKEGKSEDDLLVKRKKWNESMKETKMTMIEKSRPVVLSPRDIFF